MPADGAEPDEIARAVARLAIAPLEYLVGELADDRDLQDRRFQRPRPPPGARLDPSHQAEGELRITLCAQHAAQRVVTAAPFAFDGVRERDQIAIVRHAVAHAPNEPTDDVPV